MPETTASKVAIAITTKFTHVNIGESVSVGKAKMPYAPRSRMYCVNSTMQIATICDTVFALPQLFAGITLPCSTAIRRMDVTANSRTIIRSTNTVFVMPFATKQTSADITMILSAKGSISLPKFVMR